MLCTPQIDERLPGGDIPDSDSFVAVRQVESLSPNVEDNNEMPNLSAVKQEVAVKEEPQDEQESERPHGECDSTWQWECKEEDVDGNKDESLFPQTDPLGDNQEMSPRLETESWETTVVKEEPEQEMKIEENVVLVPEGRIPVLKQQELPPLSCKVCGKWFLHQSVLQRHIVTCHQAPFECSYCCGTFSRIKCLVAHVRRFHGGGFKPQPCGGCKSQNPCGGCKSQQPSEARARPYGCTVCGQTFVFRAHLVRHALSHTGEKPFQCSTCHRSFEDMRSLEMHNQLPYRCIICCKRLSGSIALAAHQREHAPFHCAECGREFARPETLKVHMLWHSGSLPYKCEVCGTGFPKEAVLVRHRRIHSEH